MAVFSNSRYITTHVDLANYHVFTTRIREFASFNSSKLFDYRVRRGDNLRLLSYRVYGTPDLWWAILDANPQYVSELDVTAGDFIKIPPASEVSRYV